MDARRPFGTIRPRHRSRLLIYIGDLGDLFHEAARSLRPGDWFAFSIEECESAEYTLLASGRYAQSQPYIRRLAEPAFTVVAADTTVIRMESDNPLMGRLYLLQKH